MPVSVSINSFQHSFGNGDVNAPHLTGEFREVNLN